MADTYSIPQSVRNNARRGLELRKKHGRGGTSTGMATARTLAKGGTIGLEKVRHIARYFPRHANDNLDDKTSNGWIAWLLWGGTAGRNWSQSIVKRADGDSSWLDCACGRSFIGEATLGYHLGTVHPDP